MWSRRIVFLLLAGVCQVSYGQKLPPLPYMDWGACPFECCTYRGWEATREVKIYTSRKEGSKISFVLAKGELAIGVTGVVLTKSYGITKILKPVKIGYTPVSTAPELSLKAGDFVYTLHYAGEASDFFWYRGSVYTDQILVPEIAMGSSPNEQSIEIVSRPDYEWWVKVQNKAGRVGWTKETKVFAHMDACE